MSVFDDALADVFANEDLAKASVWFAGGVGAGVALQIMLKSPDVISGFGAVRVLSDSVLAEVLVIDAPGVSNGDRIDVDGTSYDVQGEPVRDAQRLIWTIELTKQ